MIETLLKDVMTPDPVKLTLDSTVDQVHEIFESHRFHHIPVVDKNGTLQGIVSKVDLQALSYGRSLFKIQNKESFNRALYRSLMVKDIMTKDVKALCPDDTIESALKIFEKNLFHAIPIIDDGQLKGIVSCYDLLLYAYKKDLRQWET